MADSIDLPPIIEPVVPAAVERGIPFTTYAPQWSQYVRRVVVVLLIIAGVAMLTTLIPVFQILMMTGLLAFLFYMPSRMLAHRTALNFPCSVMVVYAILVVVLILVFIALIPNIVNAIESVGQAGDQLLARVINTVQTMTAETATITIPVINVTVDAWPVIGPVQAALTGDASAAVSGVTTTGLDFGAILGTLTSITTGLVGSVATVLTTGMFGILLSFLILLDLPRYQLSVANSVTPIYRREVYLLIGQIIAAWNGFFRGQLVIVILIGILTWLQLTVMGISNAIGVAVIVALISLIPTLGGIISLGPIFLLPLLTGSTVPLFANMSPLTLAVLVTVIFLIWSQVVWTIIAPKILGDAVAIPLPAIIIGIPVGLAIGGILGAFLIVPILGTLRIILAYIIRKLNGKDPFPGMDSPEVIDLSKL